MRPEDARGLVAMCLLLLLILGIALSVGHKPPDPPPEPAAANWLVENPGLYDGRRVLITTAAFQVEPDRTELAYRKIVPGPALIVIRFDGPVPNPVPPRVSGVVSGQKPVVISSARSE